MKHLFLIIAFGASINFSFAQDDLMNLLATETKDSNATEYATATFKGNRVINGQSVETVGKKVLSFVISHRFGRFSDGAYNFFGLDKATIRLGFEYGITDRLELGLGRNSLNKVYDGYLKYRFLRQSKGAKRMPVTMVLFSSVALVGIKQPALMDDFNNRLNYTTQLLIARKFSKSLSLQLTPTYIHRNLVAYKDEKNDVLALGISGRYKLTNRLSVNAEYFYMLPNQTYYREGVNKMKYDNSLSIGFDIETGGHVFQLHCTNSMGMIDKAFIAETTGKWSKGDIMFGFNVTRPFTLGRDKKKDK